MTEQASTRRVTTAAVGASDPYGKAAFRPLPFLMPCYVAAFLDRVNVGFAKLTMLPDLHIGEAAFGFGAGLFFIGYFIFETPSNVLMHRVHARRRGSHGLRAGARRERGAAPRRGALARHGPRPRASRPNVQEDPVTPLVPIIDHVVISVMGKLDEAADQFARLGFRLTERGHHTLGTSNNLAILEADYLELLGHERSKADARPDAWVSPPGLGGLVFKPPAEPALSDALNAAGVRAAPAREFSRPVAVAEGVRDARFRTVNLVEPLPNGRVFFCHHHTPELVWRDEWRRHPNGATAIVEFTIATADPARSAAVFGRMFGAAALRPVEGGLALPAAGASVLFLTPEAVSRQYGGAAPVQPDGADRMVALGLRTSSLRSARDALRGGDVAGVVETDGLITVPDGSACGLALTFRS